MNEFSIGQIVIPKAGHDMGEFHIILGQDETFLYIADGRRRKIEKPKKKKKKHVQPTLYIADDVKEKIVLEEKVLDSDIRNAIELYKNKTAKGE